MWKKHNFGITTTFSVLGPCAWKKPWLALAGDAGEKQETKGPCIIDLPVWFAAKKLFVLTCALQNCHCAQCLGYF